MRSIRSYPPVVTLLAAGLLISACAAGSAGSRAMYDWEAGTTVTYELTTLQTLTVEVPGGGAQDISSTSSVTMEVVSTGSRTSTRTGPATDSRLS